MPQPNVVLITAHDLGRHLGCYGVDTVETPRIDALADRGVRFEDAYSTAAVCSPGRGSLLTGRYPQSNGLLGLTHDPWGWSLDAGEVAFPAVLREHGYETHLAGFHHVDQSNPGRLGYETVHAGEFEAETTVGAAGSVLDDADDPFFLQVGFTEVHRSFDHGVHDEDGVTVPPYLEATETTRADLARFQAAVGRFDSLVGQVLDALDRSGHREDTVVVLTSDHGIPYPGAKWCLRRAGIEVPLVVAGPTGAERDAVGSVASLVDVVPTLLDVVGAPTPDPVEGVSFADHLAGDAPAPREAAFAQYTEDMKRDNESRCVVTDDWHLIRYFDQGRTVDYPVDVDPVAFADHVERMPTAGTRPYAQLFDLRNDPHELDDRGGDSDAEDRVEALSGRLLSWMAAVDDPLLGGPTRLPYYEAAMRDLYADGASGAREGRDPPDNVSG
jgi:arylsulfatase A-like enzyme